MRKVFSIVALMLTIASVSGTKSSFRAAQHRQLVVVLQGAVAESLEGAVHPLHAEGARTRPPARRRRRRFHRRGSRATSPIVSPCAKPSGPRRNNQRQGR
jgi:hypothetical protein